MSTLKAIDISGWQHDDDVHTQIDYAQVHETGVRLVIVKATEGLRYTNPWLETDILGFKAMGCLTGAYHYAVPNEGDAIAQAEFALKATDHLPLDIGVSLDLEETGSLPGFGQCAPWAQEFMKRINEDHEDAPLYIDRWVGSQMPGAPWGHRLWLALGQDTIPPDLPPGLRPWIVQYTAKPIRGIIGDVDHDELLYPRGVNPSRPGPAKPTPKPAAAEASDTPVVTTEENPPAKA